MQPTNENNIGLGPLTKKVTLKEVVSKMARKKSYKETEVFKKLQTKFKWDP